MKRSDDELDERKLTVGFLEPPVVGCQIASIMHLVGRDTSGGLKITLPIEFFHDGDAPFLTNVRRLGWVANITTVQNPFEYQQFLVGIRQINEPTFLLRGCACCHFHLCHQVKVLLHVGCEHQFDHE
jgi:hypothetical protein